MNYCTKCESYYQKPGTCNCFAGSQPAKVTILPQPYDPNGTVVPWQPYQPYQPYWGGFTYTVPYDGCGWTLWNGGNWNGGSGEQQ